MFIKALSAVQKYNMLSQNDKVVVGLSGGADSCALLHFLVSVREKFHLTVAACHINHQLRGAEADRDEKFAGEFCKSLDVPLYILHADVRGEALKQKKSTEQCGRDIRYSFFAKTADMLHAKIATAHTAQLHIPPPTMPKRFFLTWQGEAVLRVYAVFLPSEIILSALLSNARERI